MPLSILAKYLIIAPLAFGITLGLYEYGIRRVNLVRWIFGLKVRKHEPALLVGTLPPIQEHTEGVR